MKSAIEDKIDKYFSKFPKRSYPKGQILLFAEEKPEHVYYIVSGRVRMYTITNSGDEVIVNIFKTPAFFPMSWAINRAENLFFYKTEDDATVHIVPPDDALTFLKDNPDVLLDLLSRVYRGMEGIYMKMVHLMTDSAQTRLIYELIIESRRFGKQNKNGQISLSITESDLAARSGLTRETISREFQKLKELDILTKKGKNILINSLYELQGLMKN